MSNEELVRRYLPLLVGLAAFAASLILLDMPTVAWGGFEKLAHLAGIVALSGVLVIVARHAIGPQKVAESAAANAGPADTWMRQRIAPIVLTGGTLAITVISALLIIVFWRLAAEPVSNNPIREKLDAILMSIFTATLPVFATWVGTVLAFYFTNESFKQASEAALLAANPPHVHLAPASSRMIPYEKIAKLEVDRGGVRSTLMSEVHSLFNDQTTRVIVFDKARSPVFIIRRKNVPAEWIDETGKFKGLSATIDDYLKASNNAADAVQFGFSPQSVSIEQALRALQDSNSDDLFLTATGQKTEAVTGWLTRARLT
ncbi:hypothetical protein [Neorhizobium alkalisoli]|uniref:hypothetical protein n=1 Tax=Neorhizobium alkalisoli TaxID=528178 RepID=UPI001319CA30|nr:hypothetical protein [Neorhizobium alkalisoli]